MKLIKVAALLSLVVTTTLTAVGQAGARKYNIVFIGNSITYGATLKVPAVECPPFQAVQLLRAGGDTIRYANCGHSGSTTVDFLPASQRLFLKVLQAADTLYDGNTRLVFSISLGTNDSAIEGPTGAPVSPADYKRNLKTIIDSLHTRYPNSIFVLQRPIWYSPSTYNRSKYLAEGLARLQTYTPELNDLAKEHRTYILKGDRNAFDFFKKNAELYFTTEKGNAGNFYLHPNAAGAAKLAKFWADNLKSVIAAHYRNAAHK